MVYVFIVFITHFNKLNKRKYMHQALTIIEDLSNFSLVKYQQDQIVLTSKNSKKAFSFHSLQSKQKLYPKLSHPTLMRPILYRDGIIYSKGISTLKVQIQNKRRSSSNMPFTQEQIFNTFSPIIECVDYLHQNKVVHAEISEQSIVFEENGEIFLKDWLYKSKEKVKYYNQKQQYTFSDDMRVLGLMIQNTIIPSQKSQEQKLFKIIKTNTNNFCYALIILLQGMSQHFKHVLTLMKNEKSEFHDDKVLAIYKKFKTVKKQEPITESKMGNSIQMESPIKKVNLTLTNKRGEHQNKKTSNEELKKKKIQKINKIIERSNAFVNELIAKKNSDHKFKKQPYESGSLYETLKRSNYKEGEKIGSPLKRMKVVTKKK